MAAAKVAHVASWKHDLVEELAQRIAEADIIGIVDISGLPAKQFQEIRQGLRGQATIVVARNTLLRLALERTAEGREGLTKLLDFIRGETGLVLSQVDPFKLNKFLRQSRVKAPAKPGSKASHDIVIPAGETDLPPGPVLGELQRAGIKARIQAGKVVVLEDCPLLKAGDVITAELSDILAKFGILPVELGLRLRAAFQDGLIYTADLLEVDEGMVSSQLQEAVAGSFNLAVNICYPTTETIGLFLGNAGLSARNLAVNAGFPTKEVIRELLSLAHGRMLSFASVLGQKDEAVLDERLKGLVAQVPEPAKEEKPAEEKPKEEEKKEEELAGLGKLFG
jgi:large subunit ribosomal protein L10